MECPPWRGADRAAGSIYASRRRVTRTKSPLHQRPLLLNKVTNSPQSSPPQQTSLKSNTMTITPNDPIAPTSPPAKRIKTDTTPETMDSSNGTAKHQLNSQPPALLIKKLSDKARLPTRGSAFAAGYDLYAARDTTIPARGKALVDTDISMSVPAGTCESTLFPYLLLPYAGC
jgi:hypothetical protein